MKMLMTGLASLFVAVAAGVSGRAEALPPNATSYVYYSGQQVIGQSILYCDGNRQHWGDARSNNLSNAVAVTFSCGTGLTTHVAYPAAIDPWVTANFCSQSGLCEVGPWPVPGAGTLLSGYYSN